MPPKFLRGMSKILGFRQVQNESRKNRDKDFPKLTETYFTECTPSIAIHIISKNEAMEFARSFGTYARGRHALFAGETESTYVPTYLLTTSPILDIQPKES